LFALTKNLYRCSIGQFGNVWFLQQLPFPLQPTCLLFCQTSSLFAVVCHPQRLNHPSQPHRIIFGKTLVFNGFLGARPHDAPWRPQYLVAIDFPQSGDHRSEQVEGNLANNATPVALLSSSCSLPVLKRTCADIDQDSQPGIHLCA